MEGGGREAGASRTADQLRSAAMLLFAYNAKEFLVHSPFLYATSSIQAGAHLQGSVETEGGRRVTHSTGGARVSSWCSRSVCRSLRISL